MKRALFVVLAASSCAFAQERGNVIYQAADQVTIGAGAFDKGPGPVVGAPYSATITNESVQTLADGNRIVQTNTGSTARDSQGRTRQDTALPPIGNLSAADAPHLIFIHDPISQTSYTLNLREKIAHKMPALPPLPPGTGGMAGAQVTMRVEGNGAAMSRPDIPVTIAAAPAPGLFFEKRLDAEDQDQTSTEDLGTQNMEGVLVKGLRTTHTIPTGQIGNERPITIVTEVWTSPDLKTVVYSKRSDPRMGEQTFHLTNIVRGEPSPSLFTVPADFKIVDDGGPVFYRTKQ